jgi:DNA-binding response OmpR family regulator
MGNILIVEDDPNIRKLVRVNLTKRGYTVSEAEDSHQAIAHFQAEPVDLVVLDLMLPGLSGVDVCKWIREPNHLDQMNYWHGFAPFYAGLMSPQKLTVP